MSDSHKEHSDTKQQGDAQPIFRDEALAYIATPSDVNKIISVVGSGTWVLIFVFSVAMLMGLGWMFWGSIPITLQGQGILIPKGGIFKTVTSPEGFNVIKDLSVKSGDLVEKDQIIALLDNPEITKNIEVRKTYIADLTKKRDDLIIEAKQSIEEKKENNEKQRKIIEAGLATKATFLKQLESNLDKQKDLYQKGYAKQQNVLDVETQINNIKEENTRSKEKLVQLQKELIVDQESWAQRHREISLKLSDEQRGLEDLKTRQETTRVIKSPLKGKIIGVLHKVKDTVPANEPLITISQGNDSALEGLVYLNPLEGKEVKVGMKVYMIPTHLEKEHVGYVKGEVMEVSAYPETVSSLMSTLQNAELVKKFTEQSPPISTRVRILDSSIPTTPSVEKFKLSPGTWIYGRVIVENRSPFSIVIPELKKAIEIAP
jgi:HlyD family secretion protein